MHDDYPNQRLTLAAWAHDLQRPTLEEGPSDLDDPRLISLVSDLPSADLFPNEALGRSIARVLETDPQALQYAPPPASLRASVAELMQRRGVTCVPEQILLTAGAQQAFSLLVRLFVDPKSKVLVEEYCYPGFLQALFPRQPRIEAIPTDPKYGLDVETLWRALDAGLRPRLLYAMPDGHNPLGVSLSTEARTELVELARECDFPIIEDDAYGLFPYDDEEMPTLHELGPDCVFYVGSFSSALAPALRTGWIVVPERLMGLLSALKESSDTNTATLGQLVVADFIDHGELDDHVKRLRVEYARRRDALLGALEREFPEDCRWSTPRAGFFVWVELPEKIDVVRLYEVALEREHVTFIPGVEFAATDPPSLSTLRLSFGRASLEQIEEGVARIGRALSALGARRSR